MENENKLEHYYKVARDAQGYSSTCNCDIALVLHTILYASADAITMSKGEVTKDYICELIKKYVDNTYVGDLKVVKEDGI